MATLVSPTNTVIDKDLKKIQAKKNPAWAQCQSVKPAGGLIQ